MSPPLLQLLGISKSFGALRALQGVSFELQAGEVHALLGENGAGKSTLIKVITGAHLPDEGTIDLFGERVHHLTPTRAHRRGVACIYQQPALFPDLTVAENIALRLEPVRGFARVDWPARHQRAREILERLGASIPLNDEVRSLSMPRQQLVEIACVLGAGARIVIMDEPTASLTRREQEMLFTIVRDLRRQGLGVIYISHRLEEIFALADRVTVLRDGENAGTRRLFRPGNDAVAQSSRPPPGLPAMDAPVTEAELISLMVGRALAGAEPPTARPSGRKILELRGLSRKASGIARVTLEVGEGEIVGLAGLVGAGRTELARMVFGLTPADAGDMMLEGRRVALGSPAEAVRLGIAYVPEDRRRHGVILELPIAHNISLAIHRRLFPGGWLRPKAERALALDSIRELGVKAAGPEAPAASLSGGNQQKIAFARWLATRPRLLILDEPTQGVDVAAKGEIHRIVRRLAHQGIGVLLISSDLPEVLGLSDRLYVMRGGTVVAEFPAGAEAQEVMAAALGTRPLNL